MTQILRMSNLYAPTLKEDPSDADIDSARLLLRAGMLRKAASGLYTFLPLGFRVLKKIENIVREEMDASGAQEILMPVLQPAELWEESGRLNDYGPELMRLTDRHDREMCLGPTHEEIIVALGAQRAALLQGTASEPLPNSDEVPRRDSPALRSFALPRVRHEGRLQLQRHPGVAAGNLRRHGEGLRRHLHPLRLGLPRGGGRWRPDRRAR